MNTAGVYNFYKKFLSFTSKFWARERINEANYIKKLYKHYTSY
jgi:hypothetical protein